MQQVSTPVTSDRAARSDAIEDLGKVIGNRSIDSSALSCKPKVNAADGTAVARYLVQEMKTNSRSDNEFFSSIRKLIKSSEASIDLASKASYLYEAMRIFKSQVGYKRPWDQKDYIVGKWGKLSRLHGVLVDYDVWSNIHYGYIGTMVGFSKSILFSCAGLAQAYYSEVPANWLERFLLGSSSPFAALDDPRDQDAIAIGVELANLRSTSVVEFEEFIAFLKPRMGRIVSDRLDPPSGDE
jgi:hypothetical protein